MIAVGDQSILVDKFWTKNKRTNQTSARIEEIISNDVDGGVNCYRVLVKDSLGLHNVIVYKPKGKAVRFSTEEL